jgi:exonuclease SbcD
MKFLHISDVHLGCRRYNLVERMRDFARAWIEVVSVYAIENKVDFVLVCGDLFDRRNVEPQAMNHAMSGLMVLKEANIPVVVIEGNHDQHESVSSFQQKGSERTFSWLRSLSEWGFIYLLEPVRDEDGNLALKAWNEEKREGSYVDIAGARIFGSYWYGASSNYAIPILSDALRRARDSEKFNILMLHTDVEGQINRPIPALSVEKLKELKSLVDYVALGHTHKRFEIDNWAFNPGSLEACSIDEYREERGAFLVEVDEQKNIKATHLTDYIQRPFQRLSFDVSGAVDAEAVHLGVMDVIEREANKHDADSKRPAPIIEMTLRGHLGFKNSLLDLRRLKEEIIELTGALHIIVRNQSVPVEYAADVGLDAQAPRHERERRIIENLIMNNNRYKQHAPEMAELVIKSKEMILSGKTSNEILETIQQTLETTADNDKPEKSGAMSALERNALA